jgi:hypothetical protein
VKQRPSAIPSRCDILIIIKLEINLSIRDGFHPRLKPPLLQVPDEWVTLVSKKYIEHISILCARHSNLVIFIDVLVDNVVREGNFFERLCTRDDNLACAEDTACNLLHLMRRFELHLYRRIPVGFKRNFEYVIVPFKPIRNLHQIDVIVQTEVRIDHDNPERINRDPDFQIQKDFENVNELCDDTLAIEKITASSNLNRTVGKDLDRLGTVRVVVGQCHLVIERRGFEFPLETIHVSTTSHPVRPNLFKHTSKTLDVDILDKVGYHRDRGDLYPRRFDVFG